MPRGPQGHQGAPPRDAREQAADVHIEVVLPISLELQKLLLFISLSMTSMIFH